MYVNAGKLQDTSLQILCCGFPTIHNFLFPFVKAATHYSQHIRQSQIPHHRMKLCNWMSWSNNFLHRAVLLCLQAQFVSPSEPLKLLENYSILILLAFCWLSKLNCFILESDECQSVEEKTKKWASKRKVQVRKGQSILLEVSY